jgi:DNA-binding transcriptional regulator YbjK
VVEIATRTGPTRSSGVERRQLILDATLRLIAREGIRAVRHRAVASEADVPLAATTYYFKSIEDLLAESFRYWTTEKDVYLGEYRHSLQKILPVYTAAAAGSVERLQQAGAIRDATVAYVVKQAQLLDDRTIELAFKHEALRSEHLRELVMEQDRCFIEDVYTLVEAIGSSEPDSDAEITLGIILRLEQQAVIRGIDQDQIHRVITRHLQHLLEVDIE